MRFGSQVVWLGGVVLFGGSLLAAGNVLAFGQQWRPAPGFMPGQAQPYQPVSAMPGFRPRVAVARPYQPHDRIQQRPLQQRVASRQAYPQRPPDRRMGGSFYPPSQFAPAGHAVAPWAYPVGYMAPAWPQQAPLFTRQFGWQTGVNPWVARAPVAMPRQPHYRYPVASRMSGFRPAGAGYGVVSGGWRPALQAAPAMAPQYAYQAPVYTASRQPAFSSARSFGPPLPGANVRGLNPAPVAAARPYWRPDPVYPTAAWRSGAAFRPLAYGRSAAGEARVAARDDEGRGFTRDTLPGWVTTYQEANYADSCNWCGGS